MLVSATEGRGDTVRIKIKRFIRWGEQYTLFWLPFIFLYTGLLIFLKSTFGHLRGSWHSATRDRGSVLPDWNLKSQILILRQFSFSISSSREGVGGGVGPALRWKLPTPIRLFYLEGLPRKKTFCIVAIASCEHSLYSLRRHFSKWLFWSKFNGSPVHRTHPAPFFKLIMCRKWLNLQALPESVVI